MLLKYFYILVYFCLTVLGQWCFENSSNARILSLFKSSQTCANLFERNEIYKRIQQDFAIKSGRGYTVLDLNEMDETLLSNLTMISYFLLPRVRKLPRRSGNYLLYRAATRFLSPFKRHLPGNYAEKFSYFLRNLKKSLEANLPEKPKLRLSFAELRHDLSTTNAHHFHVDAGYLTVIIPIDGKGPLYTDTSPVDRYEQIKAGQMLILTGEDRGQYVHAKTTSHSSPPHDEERLTWVIHFLSPGSD